MHDEGKSASACVPSVRPVVRPVVLRRFGESRPRPLARSCT